MRHRSYWIVPLGMFALAACGKVGDLEPKAGQAMPAKAYGHNEIPTAEELSTPSVQARPGRSDELMRRSERRRDDPFDLPPGDPVATNPAAENAAATPAPEPQ